MTTPMTQHLVEKLRDARNQALDEAEEIPDAIEIREYAPYEISVHAPEWGPVVLFGRCINLRGDGPDLDEQNRLVWSWAVGRIVGKKHEPGAYGDLNSTVPELLRQLEARKPRRN